MLLYQRGQLLLSGCETQLLLLRSANVVNIFIAKISNDTIKKTPKFLALDMILIIDQGLEIY